MNNQKKVLYQLDHLLLGWLTRLLYPKYYRPKFGYMPHLLLHFRYTFFQKILRINGRVPWPVHFTSQVLHYKNIDKGILVDPADTMGCYINAKNGIIFGSNIEIGPGTKIISANHDYSDYRVAVDEQPIIIESNVWIGANAVILPGVKIGHNTIIGAGSVVTRNIPPNSIAVGNPCVTIKEKPIYKVDVSTIKLNRKHRLISK